MSSFAAEVQLLPVTVPLGTLAVEVPILVKGVGLVSDMQALVLVNGGGPTLGGTVGPRILRVDFAGSIWNGADGGFLGVVSDGLPLQAVELGVSLLTPGRRVLGSGQLAVVTLDLTGVGAGTNTLWFGAPPHSSLFAAGIDSVFVAPASTTLIIQASAPIARIRLAEDGAVVVFFQSSVGQRYIVQRRQDLNASVWTDVSPRMDGNGGVLEWHDLLPGSRSRFYRLRLE